MNDETRNLIEALIGHARERFGSDEDPVDDPFAWGEFKPFKRYEWAALLALRSGDLAAANVMAQLSQAAAIDHLGFNIWEFLQRPGDDD